MKNYYFIALLFLCAMSQAQDVDIPDANFKHALVNTLCVDTDGDGFGDSDADINNDGEIQVSEAVIVSWLRFGSENIASLEGIGSFTNLRKFFFSDNLITSLDLTQNPNIIDLTCFGNNLLVDLIIGQNANLLYLGLYESSVTSLDVSQNPNLRFLFIANNSLTSLDVSQNHDLRSLSCQENQLISLNIQNGNNIDMTLMLAQDNPSLRCIQVDDETATYPVCTSNGQSGWCKDSIVIYREDCILGLEDTNYITLTMFPNPTQNILNIQSRESIQNVKIYSLQGQLVKAASSSSIDVSSLTKGLYFAQVSIEGKILTKKFIKS